MKLLENAIFGEKLIFGEPEKKPKGWYIEKARRYVKQFFKAMEEGKCTTGMAKIPTNPQITKDEKMSMYNAFKALRRRDKVPVDVSIIEDDLWLIYEG